MRSPAPRLSFGLAILALLSTFALPQAHAGEDPKSSCLASVDAGQVARDQGRLRQARAEFLACGRPECPVLVQRDCVAWSADVQQRLPELLIRARDDSGVDVFDVSVSMDGEVLVDHLDGRLIAVDAGEHRFRFVRPSGASTEQVIVVREGEKSRTIDVVIPSLRAAGSAKPEERRPSRSLPVLPLVFGGVAIAGGVTFGVLASGGSSDVDRMRSTCRPNCPQDDVDAADRKLLVANVALGVGIVALGAAIWTFLGSQREHAAE